MKLQEYLDSKENYILSEGDYMSEGDEFGH